jgi:hypothetical protein
MSDKNKVRREFLPNTSPVPNFILDVVMQDPEFPESALKVLLFLLRKTIGWNKHSDKQSWGDIQRGARVGRHSAKHAISILCDCFEFFTYQKGSGKRKSNFTVVKKNMTVEHYNERLMLLAHAYQGRTMIPTAKELKAKRCTPGVLEQARKAMVAAETAAA